MVTIGLSTLSVVTSIFIVRLSGVSRPLPFWARRGVFRTVARFTCVHLPPHSTVAPHDDNGRGSTAKLVADSDVISLDTGNNSPNDSRDIGIKIDELLHEMRKVGRYA